jgi:thymidylate synthase
VEEDIKSNQPPCLDLVQALVQNNILHLTAYFRSNDMFGAWPQNVLALRKMQGLISQEVDTKLGNLTTISCSAHIYEQDFERAQNIIKKHTDQLRCQWDPRGNLAIALDRIKQEIIASHYSADGLKISEYRAKTARELWEQLDKNLAVSQLGHAFYLGQELTRAEVALKQNLEYHQE